MDGYLANAPITVIISKLEEKEGNDYPLISLEISMYSYIYYILIISILCQSHISHLLQILFCIGIITEQFITSTFNVVPSSTQSVNDETIPSITDETISSTASATDGTISFTASITDGTISYSPSVTHETISYIPSITDGSISYTPSVTHEAISYRPSITDGSISYSTSVNDETISTGNCSYRSLIALFCFILIVL